MTRWTNSSARPARLFFARFQQSPDQARLLLAMYGAARNLERVADPLRPISPKTSSIWSKAQSSATIRPRTKSSFAYFSGAKTWNSASCAPR